MSKKNRKHIKHFVVLGLFAITLWYTIGPCDTALDSIEESQIIMAYDGDSIVVINGKEFGIVGIK